MHQLVIKEGSVLLMHGVTMKFIGMCVSSFVVTIESTFQVIFFNGCRTIQIPSGHSEHDLFQPVCVLTVSVTGTVVIYHSNYMKNSAITKQDLRVNGQFMLIGGVFSSHKTSHLMQSFPCSSGIQG